MKPRYLDKRNFHALLPASQGLPVFQRLDECLCQINDRPGQFQGLFDKLVQQNKNTSERRPSSSRLLNVQLDVYQALYPQEKAINLQATDRPYPGPAQLHTIFEYENGIAWKTLVPLQYILKGWGDANADHQTYIHSISRGVPRKGTVDQLLNQQKRDDNSFYYVGITGRNWLERLREHLGAARRGSMRSFYSALRESLGWEGVLYVSSLREINQSYDEAMNWEEAEVEKVASDKYGLNMIPGGFKGLQYLHQLGHTRKVIVSLEERDRAIATYVKLNPRKGIPNALVKAWWEDDAHYEQINDSHPKRLSSNQRKEALRLQADGFSSFEIAQKIGALNERQVCNFLSGKTYKRGLV